MRRRNGFSLIELLIVVTMIGLVAAISLPRMSAIRQQMQLDTAAQQLVGDLRRAKIEALKRNKSVSVTSSGASSYSVQFVGPRVLDGNVTFSGPDSVTFAAFGPPLTGPTTYTLTLGEHTRSVALSAAGMPTVQ